MSYSISVSEAPPSDKHDASGEKTSENPKAAAPAPGGTEALTIIEELPIEELELPVEETPAEERAPKIKELLESPDPPSRFITYLSFAFALLAIACVGMLVSKYLEARKARHATITEVAPPPPEKIFTEPLGEFKLVLKGNESPNDGELRVDMTAECSTEAACLYLKEHLVQARDIVIPVLVNLRREELLKPDSKNLIRRRIAEQLNSLPMKGKIIQILFTDLTIENTDS